MLRAEQHRRGGRRTGSRRADRIRRAPAFTADAGALVADYYLEDFEPGRTYSSPTHTVTDEEALDFARRYDPQYFHLDPVAARESVFGGLVLGGFQTAALSWALVLRSGMFDRCAMAGVGLDEVRWPNAVRPGDRLRCDFTLLDARPSKSRPEGGVARFRYEMKNQREEIVLSLIMIQLLRRRG
jgi:acyl dehydratase